MIASLLPAIEVDPVGPASATVIWLHGLGADGGDFAAVPDALGLEGRGVRYVFPHAPLRAVTINAGQTMRAWYDIRSWDLARDPDGSGLEASRRGLEAWIEHESQRGIPPRRQILAGFSQGGAVALHTALRYPERLAGVMALSTYLPFADRLAQAPPRGANAGLPILMAHGDADPVVPPSLAEAGRDVLEDAGYALEWRVYPMQHSVCPPEVDAIRTWLARVLDL